MSDERVAEGVARIEPQDAVVAGRPGTWTLTFTAGDGGLPAGSALRIAIPDGFSPPQSHNSDAPGFVRAEVSSVAASLAIATEPLPGGEAEWGEASDGGGPAGTEEGTGRAGLLLVLGNAPIKRGDYIRLTYGAGPARAYGSPFAGRAPFGVWVRTHADSDGFDRIREFPTLSVVAGSVARIEAVAALPLPPAPSRGAGDPSVRPFGAPQEGSGGERPATAAGEGARKFAVRVIARDAAGNRCRGWKGWLEATSQSEGLHLPAIQRVEDATGDGVVLSVGVAKPGTVPIRIRVRERESGCEAVTNPIATEGTAPLWGDLHACVVDESPSRAELDFELAVGSRPPYDLESFAFDPSSPEAAATGQEGAKDMPVLRCSLPDRSSEAMLSTHLIEVYTSWGCRERWSTSRPDIRYDRSEDRTAQAVLAAGVVAGFGAGSNSRLGTGGDAVAAEPGRGYSGGLTAVFADSVSEAAIFRALRERRCYATTGHRPLLHFTVSDHAMGSVVDVGRDDRGLISRRQVSTRVHGTAAVNRIEVVRNNLEVCTYRGEGADVAFTWADEHDLTRIALPRSVRGGAPTAYYYVRVTQEDGNIAWSSPVWFVVREKAGLRAED